MTSTKRTFPCNCGVQNVSREYTMFGRTAMFCERCIAAYEQEQSPSLPAKQKLADPRYGWDATVADTDRVVAELAQAIEAWHSRDRESGSLYHLASKVSLFSRSLDANASHLARLEALRG